MVSNTAFSAPFSFCHAQTSSSFMNQTRSSPSLYSKPRNHYIHIRATLDPKNRPSVHSAEDLIRTFWNLASTGQFTSTLYLFSEDAVYYDTLYPNPFQGKEAIAKHLHSMESAIPPGLTFVLDDVAAGSKTVGARWHVEAGGGKQIPFSRGASMYTIIEDAGQLRITEGWDFVETPFKVAGLVLPLLRVAASVLRFFGKSAQKGGT